MKTKINYIFACKKGDWGFSLLPCFCISYFKSEKQKQVNYVLGIWFWYIEIERDKSLN